MGAGSIWVAPAPFENARADLLRLGPRIMEFVDGLGEVALLAFRRRLAALRSDSLPKRVPRLRLPGRAVCGQRLLFFFFTFFFLLYLLECGWRLVGGWLAAGWRLVTLLVSLSVPRLVTLPIAYSYHRTSVG
jgi:hypothetical protein